ncbi:MAG: hypothetical protein HQ519_17880 [Planctomycetes bacterium]|nr:hypothetical protein [Planctomycetota bacterium]
MLRFPVLVCLLLCSCALGSPAVEIEFPTGGAPMNQHFSFIADLGDVELLHANADMPSHGHGINTQPEWHRLDDGRWQIDGMLLHMPGYWELEFDVRLTDGSTQQLIYPLTLGH